MVKPRSFKLKCPKCGYSKTVRPKSDAMSPLDIISSCPHCGTKMEKGEVGLLDSFIDKLFK